MGRNPCWMHTDWGCSSHKTATTTVMGVMSTMSVRMLVLLVRQMLGPELNRDTDGAMANLTCMSPKYGVRWDDLS